MDRGEIDTMLRQFANAVIAESDTEHPLKAHATIMEVDFMVVTYGRDFTISRPGEWMVGLYAIRPYEVFFGDERFERDLWLLRMLG